ncbi:MAG: hypothetical protein EBZ36_18240 [Acidobacteria bacterium]|nr:hypothetical protein [Acidobacteriota bacterium]
MVCFFVLLFCLTLIWFRLIGLVALVAYMNVVVLLGCVMVYVLVYEILLVLVLLALMAVHGFSIYPH